MKMRRIERTSGVTQRAWLLEIVGTGVGAVLVVELDDGSIEGWSVFESVRFVNPTRNPGPNLEPIDG